MRIDVIARRNKHNGKQEVKFLTPEQCQGSLLHSSASSNIYAGQGDQDATRGRRDADLTYRARARARRIPRMHCKVRRPSVQINTRITHVTV